MNPITPPFDGVVVPFAGQPQRWPTADLLNSGLPSSDILAAPQGGPPNLFVNFGSRPTINSFLDIDVEVDPPIGRDLEVDLTRGGSPFGRLVARYQRTPPPFNGTGSGQLQVFDADTLRYTVVFSQATTGFAIVLPAGHQISQNPQDPPAGFSCTIEDAGSGTNNKYHCFGSLAANTPAHGFIDVSSMPAADTGQLFGFQGASQGGPFQMTGP